MKLGRREKAGTVTMERGTAPAPETDEAFEGLSDLELDAPEAHPVEPRRQATGTEPFGSLLIRRGLVSEDDVAQALIVQNDTGKRIGETLVAMGAMNERELTLFLADLLHMPVVDLRRNNPTARDARALIPEEVVREHMAMPIRLDDDGLQVAVADQPSVTVRALLTAVHATNRSASCWRPRPTSNGPSTAATGPSAAWTSSSRPSRPSRAHGGRPLKPVEAEVVADDAPIVQVVTRILTQAKRDRASDVHIEPSQDVVRVRFRIDGALKEVLMLPAPWASGSSAGSRSWRA